MSYDRYGKYRVNGDVLFQPFISIPVKDTDYYEIYEKGKTRLDILSYNYYKDADYAWLIMQANPQYGSLEYMIPDKSQIRIPYPLNITLARLDSDIENYKIYNNI